MILAGLGWLRQGSISWGAPDSSFQAFSLHLLQKSKSGEARGPGSLGGPGSWYSHGQTAHGSRKPLAGTPSRAGTPCPLPFPKRYRGGGGGGAARRRVGVPARGILRPAWGQEAWEYHEPGPPNEPGPLAFPHKNQQIKNGASEMISVPAQLWRKSQKWEPWKPRFFNDMR